MWYKIWAQFSVFSSKGAKPTLRKSDLLLHKERITLVFEKWKERSAHFALVALLKRATGAIRSRCSFCKERNSKERKSKFLTLGTTSNPSRHTKKIASGMQVRFERIEIKYGEKWQREIVRYSKKSPPQKTAGALMTRQTWSNPTHTTLGGGRSVGIYVEENH